MGKKVSYFTIEPIIPKNVCKLLSVHKPISLDKSIYKQI